MFPLGNIQFSECWNQRNEMFLYHASLLAYSSGKFFSFLVECFRSLQCKSILILVQFWAMFYFEIWNLWMSPCWGKEVLLKYLLKGTFEAHLELSTQTGWEDNSYSVFANSDYKLIADRRMCSLTHALEPHALQCLYYYSANLTLCFRARLYYVKQLHHFFYQGYYIMFIYYMIWYCILHIAGISNADLDILNVHKHLVEELAEPRQMTLDIYNLVLKPTPQLFTALCNRHQHLHCAQTQTTSLLDIVFTGSPTYIITINVI